MYNKIILSAFLLLITVPVKAATLNISADGELIGAFGVEIEGKLYDVEFVDGSCQRLFDGCNSEADKFIFPTAPIGMAAARALLDLVFIDGPQGNFDTNPGLTAGCASEVTSCRVYIPMEVIYGSIVVSLVAINGDGVKSQDGVPGGPKAGPKTREFTSKPDQVFARFTLSAQS